jgi:hypothetical protein
MNFFGLEFDFLIHSLDRYDQSSVLIGSCKDHWRVLETLMMSIALEKSRS